jgi:uncharacterized repeat protein (TIGR03803 family)
MMKPRTNKQLTFVSVRHGNGNGVGKLGIGEIACIVVVFCVATVIASSAQTFTTLASFDYAVGVHPLYGSLVQGADGNFYGTANSGGGNDTSGTIFKITPLGKLTKLYSFCTQTNCGDGRSPQAGLVLATDGNFYGTDSRAGLNDAGTIFEITAAGELTTLYQFCAYPYFGFCIDGEFPETTLVQGSDGNFYGTASEGGSDVGNYGAIFEVTSAGDFIKLHAFCTQPTCSDGNIPSTLVQGANGNFYGTTSAGGLDSAGTVFEITPRGTLATLYTFCPQSECANGARPWAGLAQAANGDFYGTAVTGGNTICSQGCGTIFKITAEGSFSMLHAFCSQTGCTDGAAPFAGLIEATDGNLYGTTAGGGTYGGGTIFKISPGGKLTTLHSFCSQTNCTDGESPLAGLVQATDGTFYGTTSGGGTDTNCLFGCGTAFSLSVGLGPFVETIPTSRQVGAAVTILGSDLIGTTSVSFNGTAATFTVLSATGISTVVPTGATTGPVQVVTPSGTLTSNVNFRVEP